MEFFAASPRGLEDLLARELQDLGIKSARAKRGGVMFSGTIEDGYRAVLWSRLASNMLLQILKFRAPDEDSLYRGASKVVWDEHLSVDDSFVVHTTLVRARFDHTHFASLRIKDAIVDQFRKIYDKRPNVDTVEPDIYIHCHVDGDDATIYIDLAGESLHRRGYRSRSTEAPLKENVAASCLIRAGWPAIAAQGGAFMDPMCGSGTFLIEAAMMATDTAPALGRESFGLERWRQHSAAIWGALIEEASRRSDVGLAKCPKIVGSDRSPDAVDASRENILNAGFGDFIQVEKHEVREVRPCADFGLVMTNPPYGIRIDDSERQAHRSLGNTLIAHFDGWRASIITAGKDLGMEVGLRAKKVIQVDNGPIQCVQLNFEIEERNIFHERRIKPLPDMDPDLEEEMKNG